MYFHELQSAVPPTATSSTAWSVQDEDEVRAVHCFMTRLAVFLFSGCFSRLNWRDEAPVFRARRPLEVAKACDVRLLRGPLLLLGSFLEASWKFLGSLGTTACLALSLGIIPEHCIRLTWGLGVSK